MHPNQHNDHPPGSRIALIGDVPLLLEKPGTRQQSPDSGVAGTNTVLAP